MSCEVGYGSPRWSGEVADCSMPMTFDTYSNCSFGCVYCFAQFQRGIGAGAQDYAAHKVKCVDVQRVKDIFTGKRDSQFRRYIEQRKTLQWGGLSDQFDMYEKANGKTLELLRFFKDIDYPLTFSTKSAWWTKDERYMELFRGQKNWNVKFSIITDDEEAASIIEPRVPSPEERLEAIGRIADADCGGATLRLRPFIIGVSSKTYKSLIRKAADRGASAMTTEFFCLERRSVNKAKENFKVISDYIGHDVVDFYARNSSGSGYLRLNRSIKEPYVRKMRDLAHSLGMRFYVSDAHFKEACDNACCCGLPDDWEISRCQFSNALQICKRRGRCTWSEISAGADFLDFMWGKAEGFNTNSVETRAKFDGMTMRDYLRYLWNNPNKGQSPYKMFGGVMVPDGRDEHGDVIYAYDSSRTFVTGGEDA